MTLLKNQYADSEETTLRPNIQMYILTNPHTISTTPNVDSDQFKWFSEKIWKIQTQLLSSPHASSYRCIFTVRPIHKHLLTHTCEGLTTPHTASSTSIISFWPIHMPIPNIPICLLINPHEANDQFHICLWQTHIGIWKNHMKHLTYLYFNNKSGKQCTLENLKLFSRFHLSL